MRTTKYIAAAAAALLMAACTEEDYLLYDTSQTDHVSFNYLNSSEEEDSVVSYSFDYDIADTHTIEIPVMLMGMPSDHDRAIELEPVADSTDMVAGTHYTVERSVLKAQCIVDTIRIKLYRNNDATIQEREFTLQLAIKDNGELAPIGQTTFTIHYSDIRPTERPSWWDTWAALPEYSFENAQLFFKYFHELAPKANKEIYDEMVEAYGEYFSDAVSEKGPFAMYDSFLYKYVLIPLYNDYPESVMPWQRVPSVQY